MPHNPSGREPRDDLSRYLLHFHPTSQITMTKSTIFVDEVTIPTGSVISSDPEREFADRILHLVEDKIHAAVGNAAKEKFVIRHPHSGRVLDVTAAGVENGTKVQLWEANQTKAREWKFDEGGSIINPRSGKCLTARGYECGGSPGLVIWEPYNNGDDKPQGVDVHYGRHDHPQGDRKGLDGNKRQPPRARGSTRAQGHAPAVAVAATFFDEVRGVLSIKYRILVPGLHGRTSVVRPPRHQ